VTEQSVIDLSVAGQSPTLYKLLWQLPTELVLDFLERASDWELRHRLADRLAGTTELLRQPVALTPGLRDRAEPVARECAEFVLRSNATLGALITQLERDEKSPLDIQWSGLDNLRRATAGDRPAVVFAPHIGYLYVVPFALAALGVRSTVLGSGIAGQALRDIFPALAPRLVERIGYLVVPRPDTARAATQALARGDLLVIFPELDRGATSTVESATATFLGRTIRLPTTAARFARIARASILPALVTPDGDRRVRVEFGEPVPAPANRHGDVPTSLRLFGWLERQVEQRPELWLAWPMLDPEMKVSDDGDR
jgi:lauroyl/myristoyl acyltransferase